MTRTARLLPLAAALSTVLAVAACGSSDGTTSASAPSQSGSGAAGKSGGTLTFAVGSDAGCTDPAQVGSNDTIYSVRQIVDSLTDQDPETGKIVPWLAQSWTVSADTKSFTFKLRPGVTFSDGTPLTASVVKANFDAVPELGAKALLATGYLSGYAGTTVVDDLTARVDFEQPNAQFLQASSTFSLGLVSEASTRLSPEDRCSKGVVGSGPFTLTTYTPNQEIDLAKRTGYAWGSSLFTKQGEAYLDRVVFKIIPEAGVRTGSLQSGQLDAIGSVGRSDEAALKGAGVDLQARANPGTVFNLGLNSSRPTLQDKAVRQAILLAIDRQQVADTIFPTGTKGAQSILASTTPLASDLSASLAQDKARATSLLDAAGWAPGADGVRAKNGQKLDLTVVWAPVAATNQPTLELLQQQLREVGIAIQLKQIPLTQFVQVQQSGDFDALWGNLTRADPDILRTQYSTKLLNTYRLPAGSLDALLTKQASTTDTAARTALVAQAQELLVDEAYVIPVVELQTELGVSKKVHDLAFEASSRIQLHDTWKD